MKQQTSLWNLIVQHGIQNAQRCARNRRDLNRTRMMAETARHQHKYSDPLTQHHAALAEDILLLTAADHQLESDPARTKALQQIYVHWQNLGDRMDAYHQIASILTTIKRE